MKSLRRLSAAFGFCLVTALAFAGDPTGTWRWTVNSPDGEIQTTLKLTLKDGKLAGDYSNSFGDAVISASSFKDDAVAFSVEREFNGNKFVLKYSGKLEGDAIKGTIDVPGFNEGEARKLEWNAKRVAEKIDGGKV